ncbi:hypothetical protein J6590_077103 [Homalodisca vitripennis]|nr:hypothetical protein J6590_077103 [Homalodisca vitripennis]
MKEAFKKLQLLNLSCLYILETTLFCISKCALNRGQDIHMYETRGRANYRTGRHRTVVYERLPAQAGVHFLNRLPDSIKDAPTPKALKTRLKRLLVSQAFYNASEFLAFDWETAQLEDWLRLTKWVALAMDERGVTVKLRDGKEKHRREYRIFDIQETKKHE